jgi:hypothetical protein
MRGVPWEQKTTGIKRLLVDMVNDVIALTKGFRQCDTERCAEVVINNSVLTSIILVSVCARLGFGGHGCA